MTNWIKDLKILSKHKLTKYIFGFFTFLYYSLGVYFYTPTYLEHCECENFINAYFSAYLAGLLVIGFIFIVLFLIGGFIYTIWFTD
jgi:hypothetical protein